VWGWDYPAATRAVDTRIAELRRALKDDAETPQFVKTWIGQGYCFIGRVEARAWSALLLLLLGAGLVWRPWQQGVAYVILYH
jgi:hypothetical protein